MPTANRDHRIVDERAVVTWREEALVFRNGEEYLVGVIAVPERPAPRGVLIVAGGPQYRVGSHRQFTLLARYLAEGGFASLRFDYRGMGDSTGSARSFEQAGDDIRVAIDEFMARVSALREVVLWGLCDAASAALFYAHSDMRVGGLVLANPWVRNEQGIARAQLKHYYATRVFHHSFWQKLFSGEVRLARTFSGLGRVLLQAAKRTDNQPLEQRMQEGFGRFRGPVLLLLSGNDLTADEFRDVVARSVGWQRLLRESRVVRQDVAGANHTFSRRDWRDEVAKCTKTWLMRGPDEQGSS